MTAQQERVHITSEKRFVVIVLACAGLFLGAGTFINIWHGRNLKAIVAEQFNDEQLVIAANVSRLIEREMNFVKKEIALGARNLKDIEPAKALPVIENAFNRVVESGVWKIDIIDAAQQKTYAYMPYRSWSIGPAGALPPEAGTLGFPSGRQPVWVSRPMIESARIAILAGTDIRSALPYRIVFHINVSWFLAPFLKDIRSGKSGYAWLIDNEGHFLFHPEVDFIGKNAFSARQEKYPQVPYTIINFIQKEKMLKGQSGTGHYVSAWHRGFTGEIEKLIAYHPVHISENPPQNWSVAVIAPVSEIQGLIQSGHQRLMLLQGFMVLMILGAAGTILFLSGAGQGYWSTGSNSAPKPWPGPRKNTGAWWKAPRISSSPLTCRGAFNP